MQFREAVATEAAPDTLLKYEDGSSPRQSRETDERRCPRNTSGNRREQRQPQTLGTHRTEESETLHGNTENRGSLTHTSKTQRRIREVLDTVRRHGDERERDSETKICNIRDSQTQCQDSIRTVVPKTVLGH